MNIIKKPFRWISAHSEAKFTFEYEKQFSIQYILNTNGFALIIFNSSGLYTLEAGDYVYVDSGEYQGYHKISSVPYYNWFVTETIYTQDQTSGNISFIEPHDFKLGAGFDYPASLAAVLPYSTIARFKPEPNADGQLVINIQGYVNKLFDVINSNEKINIAGRDVYYNLFNRVVLFIDDVAVSEHIALNSAIDMFELNQMYVNTNRSLNAGSLGEHYLSCGDTTRFYIDGDYVYGGLVYIDGDAEPALADFSSIYFSPPDFNTVGG